MRRTVVVLVAMLALAACSDATAPQPSIPDCVSVITVGPYGYLFIQGSATKDGVLTCRAFTKPDPTAAP